jgi:hypothetical protein
VSESWVRRNKQERRELNKTSPLLKRRRIPLWVVFADQILELIQQKPDLTRLSVQTFCTAFQRLRPTVKKSPHRHGT